MRKHADHYCHANYDKDGYVSIDKAAVILGRKQDPARKLLKGAHCRTKLVKTGKQGRRPLTVYFKQDVIDLNVRMKSQKVVQDDLWHQTDIKIERGTAGLRKGEADNDVYQPTYDDFFEWCCLDRNDYPSLFFREYAKLHNCFEASNSEIVKCALSHAMHECWVAWFDKAKNYLTDFVGAKKPERKEPTVFGSGMVKHGCLDFLRRRAADIAAAKEGGAK